MSELVYFAWIDQVLCVDVSKLTVKEGEAEVTLVKEFNDGVDDEGVVTRGCVIPQNHDKYNYVLKLRKSMNGEGPYIPIGLYFHYHERESPDARFRLVPQRAISTMEVTDTVTGTFRAAKDSNDKGLYDIEHLEGELVTEYLCKASDYEVLPSKEREFTVIEFIDFIPIVEGEVGKRFQPLKKYFVGSMAKDLCALSSKEVLSMGETKDKVLLKALWTMITGVFSSSIVERADTTIFAYRLKYAIHEGYLDLSNQITSAAYAGSRPSLPTVTIVTNRFQKAYAYVLNQDVSHVTLDMSVNTLKERDMDSISTLVKVFVPDCTVTQLYTIDLSYNLFGAGGSSPDQLYTFLDDLCNRAKYIIVVGNVLASIPMVTTLVRIMKRLRSDWNTLYGYLRNGKGMDGRV